MNLDAFWQTHRRFLTGIAIGLVVFIILRMILGSTWKGDLGAAQRKIISARRSLSGQHVNRSEVTRARNLLVNLAEQSTLLANACLPPLPDEFKPQAGQSPSKHYIQFTGLRRNELIGQASLRNMKLDESLGLPAVSPTQELIIEKVMRGFWVVDEMVQLAINWGAVEVDDIRINTRSSNRGKSALASVEVTEVNLEVVFSEDLLNTFLQAVVNHKPNLGLAGMEVLPLDKKGLRHVTLKFAAGALPEINEEDQL